MLLRYSPKVIQKMFGYDPNGIGDALLMERSIRRSVVALYLDDIGKSGNPPSHYSFWFRGAYNIDARTAQILVDRGLVVCSFPQEDIPMELQLTPSGASMAADIIARV